MDPALLWRQCSSVPASVWACPPLHCVRRCRRVHESAANRRAVAAQAVNQAVVFNRFDGTDPLSQIQVVNLVMPMPGPDEVLVRMTLRPVHPADVSVVKGYVANPSANVLRFIMDPMAKHHGNHGDHGAVDPYSLEGLVQRHENRQLLLQRLSSVRQQIKDLEREVQDLEQTVQGLPYLRRSLPDQLQAGGQVNRLAAAAAGGVALPLAVGIMHPLDTVRTTMQATAGRGFSEAVKALGSKGVARGFGLSFAWASPQGAIRMASYETSKDQLLDKFSAKSFGIAVSAVVADFASSVIKVPRELITQRMQTGQYSSSWTAFRSILRQDGVGGLFTGYLSTASRDTPFMVLLFFSYEQFKAWKIRLTFADDVPSQLLAPMKPWSDAETVLWGGISGALAAWLTTPFDVIKTRVMTATQALTFGDALRSVATTGATGLFAGAGPRSAWWFCVSSVFFGTYERLRSSFQQKLEE